MSRDEEFGERKVWITRSAPEATARRVAALGFHPISAPLLSFHPLAAHIEAAPGEVLAFTSINGVERTAALTTRRDLTVFAVGDATAQSARAAGFSDVHSAGGDVASLAALILDAQPQAVIHPAAEETAGDLVGRLRSASVPARKLAVYETRAARALPPAVETALGAGALAALLVHSPKAARVAGALLRDARDRLGGTVALGLSAACLAPLEALGFTGMGVAPAPTETALMQILMQMLAGQA
jgi:uroporphyrinogen-III synthase